MGNRQIHIGTANEVFRDVQYKLLILFAHSCHTLKTLKGSSVESAFRGNLYPYAAKRHIPPRHPQGSIDGFYQPFFFVLFV